MNDLMTKSFMSYVDLKKAAIKEQQEQGQQGDLELADHHHAADLAASAKEDDALASFLAEAAAVREEIAAIRGLLSRLQEANEEIKSAHQPDALRSLRSRINADVLLVLRSARSIRSRLDAMDDATARHRRLSASAAPDRTRLAVTNGLRKRLKDLMLDFQALRQRMMAEYKDTVERRYFTLTGQVPGEEVIERIIAEGQGEEMLKRAVVQEGQQKGRGELVAAVEEIQGRHDAAKEVERSLLELHQIFLDMAVMVEAQGEKMDDIEHHVTSASHYVKHGTKQLTDAKKYHRSNRKWLCIAVVLLVLLLLVVVVPVVTSVTKS